MATDRTPRKQEVVFLYLILFYIANVQQKHGAMAASTTAAPDTTLEPFTTAAPGCSGLSPPIHSYANIPEWDGADTTITVTCLPGFVSPDGTSTQLLTCSDGLTWGDYSCHDINECAADVADECDPNADCYNNPGSYICICRAGYTGDGFSCSQVTCTSVPSLPNARAVSAVPTPVLVGDEVVYECQDGYRVLQPGSPSPDGSQLESFSITCAAGGQWDPSPLPVCVPVDCGDPGVVAFATRSGRDFTFGKEVVYECVEGFHLEDQNLGSTRFTLTCQANVAWSGSTKCVDTDECTDQDICGEGVTYCINTPGSYICLDLGPFPPFKPCDVSRILNLCLNGECEAQGDQAMCKCQDGYEGVACDVKVAPPFGVLSIVAIVVVGLLAVIGVVACLYQGLRRTPPLPPPMPQRPPLPMFPKMPQFNNRLPLRRSGFPFGP